MAARIQARLKGPRGCSGLWAWVPVSHLRPLLLLLSLLWRLVLLYPVKEPALVGLRFLYEVVAPNASARAFVRACPLFFFTATFNGFSLMPFVSVFSLGGSAAFLV